LMFLRFSVEWRNVLTTTHGYLRPGGRMVTTTVSISPTEPGFQAHYAQALARFESERATLEPERQARRFAELVSQLSGVSRLGAVDPEGSVRLDVATAARGWIAADLRRRYPEFGRTIEAILGRLNPIGVDGASIIAVPAVERVRVEMIQCGFDVEVLASTRYPTGHAFAFAATRPR